MPIDISNIEIKTLDNTLSIVNNSQMMQFLTDGSIKKTGLPAFHVSRSAGWEYWSGWRDMPFNVIIRNNGNHFSNNVFNVPITGTYYFAAQEYALKDTQGIGRYWHPLFSVNGTATNTRLGGSASTNYRIRGYNGRRDYEDCQISDIMYLQAGDNVRVSIFSSHSVQRTYGPYSFFSGCLLG
jgi:hypothetical protein